MLGCVLTVVGAFSELRARNLFLPPLILFAGIALAEWRIAALLALCLAVVALCVNVLHIKDRIYAKTFPVFAETAAFLARSDIGDEYWLHIARIKRGFIIGISYEEEVDGSQRPAQTRWKEVFSTYEVAEAELLERLEWLARQGGEQTPNLSIERTSPARAG